MASDGERESVEVCEMNIKDLPYEVLLVIMDLVDILTFNKTRDVCRIFREIHNEISQKQKPFVFFENIAKSIYDEHSTDELFLELVEPVWEHRQKYITFEVVLDFVSEFTKDRERFNPLTLREPILSGGVSVTVDVKFPDMRHDGNISFIIDMRNRESLCLWEFLYYLYSALDLGVYEPFYKGEKVKNHAVYHLFHGRGGGLYFGDIKYNKEKGIVLVDVHD